MYSTKTAENKNHRTATNTQQWWLTEKKQQNEKLLVMLLHVIKYSVIFLNKQTEKWSQML